MILKELSLEKFENLNQLYLNNDFNSMKVVYAELNRLIRRFEYFETLKIINHIGFIIFKSKKELLKWISENFPIVFNEVLLGEKSILNDDSDFPKFKEQQIFLDKNCLINEDWRIKNLEIFGQVFKVKQNFQKIKSITFYSQLRKLHFEIENNFSLTITNPNNIFESFYQLRIEDADIIEIEITNKKFIFTNAKPINNNVKNDEFFNFIEDKSIFLSALEINKG